MPETLPKTASLNQEDRTKWMQAVLSIRERALFRYGADPVDEERRRERILATAGIAGLSAAIARGEVTPSAWRSLDPYGVLATGAELGLQPEDSVWWRSWDPETGQPTGQVQLAASWRNWRADVRARRADFNVPDPFLGDKTSTWATMLQVAHVIGVAALSAIPYAGPAISAGAAALGQVGINMLRSNGQVDPADFAQVATAGGEIIRYYDDDIDEIDLSALADMTDSLAEALWTGDPEVAEQGLYGVLTAYGIPTEEHNGIWKSVELCRRDSGAYRRWRGASSSEARTSTASRTAGQGQALARLAGGARLAVASVLPSTAPAKKKKKSEANAAKASNQANAATATATATAAPASGPEASTEAATTPAAPAPSMLGRAVTLGKNLLPLAIPAAIAAAFGG